VDVTLQMNSTNVKATKAFSTAMFGSPLNGLELLLATPIQEGQPNITISKFLRLKHAQCQTVKRMMKTDVLNAELLTHIKFSTMEPFILERIFQELFIN